MNIDKTIVIRITGDSGDGVQLMGEQLTVSAALSGHDVRTLPDFPAEIRAPAGTVAGVSGFQLAIAEVPLYTAGEQLDVLVALNPAALVHALPLLKEGGLLLFNSQDVSEKDWQKAGLSSSFLEQAAKQYQLVSIPLITLAVQSVASLDIRHAASKKTKNFYALGIIFWLFDLTLESCLAFIEKKFRKDALVQQANSMALHAGYNYAETLELSRQAFILNAIGRPSGDYRQITGVEAIALAAATIATKLNQQLLVAGYPITPASAILHECARLEEFGVVLFQAEDEIAAIGACLGAAFGGNLAMTVTSGPGFDLKTESLGLAVMAELPLLVLDVQRAGGSTGLPTKTGQSDLGQALYGRHGESPLPVIAATTPTNCFDTLIEAFTIAIRYMTPVVVLLDAYLANAAQPWLIPDPDTLVMPEIEFNRTKAPFTRDEKLARSWNRPGSEGYIYQLGGLEKQGEWGKVSYDAKNHQDMVQLRAKKIAQIAHDYPKLVIEGDVDSKILLVGWGSTYGCIKSCMDKRALHGLSFAVLQLRHLNPLPLELGQILKKYQRIFVVELNTGHLWQILRSTYLVDCELISQCNGQALSERFLWDAIGEKMNVEHCF